MYRVCPTDHHPQPSCRRRGVSQDSGEGHSILPKTDGTVLSEDFETATAGIGIHSTNRRGSRGYRGRNTNGTSNLDEVHDEEEVEELREEEDSGMFIQAIPLLPFTSTMASVATITTNRGAHVHK